MEELKNKYYIRLNGSNRITDMISSAQSKIRETDIQIGQGFGTQFRVSAEVLSDELQSYVDKENIIRNEIWNEKYGLYQLEYVNGVICKVSEEILEGEYEEPKQPKSPYEQLQQENLTIKLAMVEMAEAHESEKIQTQLAIAELATLVTEGM